MHINVTKHGIVKIKKYIFYCDDNEREQDITS